MVRSKWTKAVVVGLACAGAVRSQAPASNPPAAATEQVLTLQETGRPRQPCRILQTWRLPDGGTAHLLQAKQTGEMLTVVEASQLSSAPPGSGGVRAVSTRIYHWGRSTTPPPGSPLPPALAKAPSAAASITPNSINQARLAPVAPMPMMPTPAPAPIAPNAINQVRLAPAASPAPAAPMPMMQTPSTDMATRIVPTPASPSAPVPVQSQICDSAPCVPAATKHSLFGCMSKDCTSSTCNPCNPCDSCTTQAPLVQEARPSLLSRLMHRSETIIEQPSTVCCDSPPPPPASTMAAPPSVVQAPTTPAQPGDFRESWGKVEPWRPELTATETTKAPAKEHNWFWKKTVAQDSKKQPDMAASSMVPSGPGGEAMGGFPGGLPVVRPNGPPPPPPDPFFYQRAMAGAYPVYRAPMIPADQGISKDMANAFTPGGTTRPIPANFGEIEYPPNAFSAPPTDPMASAMAAGAYPQGSNGMGMPTGGAMPQFNAFYFPGMPATAAQSAMAAYRPPTLPTSAAVAMANSAAQPMIPAPAWKPTMQLPQAQSAAIPAGAGLELAPTPQLVALLRTSLYPSQREWAADCLSQQDCHKEPQAVQALVSAAKDDPAPSVRAGCVRALARLHINTPPVLAALKALRTDTDAAVRQEAEQALSAIGTAAQQHVESGLQPASATSSHR